jgi:hypothetical protein
MVFTGYSFVQDHCSGALPRMASAYPQFPKESTAQFTGRPVGPVVLKLRIGVVQESPIVSGILPEERRPMAADRADAKFRQLDPDFRLAGIAVARRHHSPQMPWRSSQPPSIFAAPAAKRPCGDDAVTT